MKNQWFGDKYDFRKYGILCFLERYYTRVLVDWMLTENDVYAYGIQSKVWDLIQSHKNVSFAEDWFKLNYPGKFRFNHVRIDENRNTWKKAFLDQVQQFQSNCHCCPIKFQLINSPNNSN